MPRATWWCWGGPIREILFRIAGLRDRVGGADMFVAKISAAGNALIGCMRIGGSSDDCVNMQDQARYIMSEPTVLVRTMGMIRGSEVVLDGQNNILVAASSQSKDFPITGTVFQPGYGGGHQDGVVVKIDPNCGSYHLGQLFGWGGFRCGVCAQGQSGDRGYFCRRRHVLIKFPGCWRRGYSGGLWRRLL